MDGIPQGMMDDEPESPISPPPDFFDFTMPGPGGNHKITEPDDLGEIA